MLSTFRIALALFQYQGDEKMDTDIPTYLEAKLFCNTFGKFCWVALQPFFYALRPVITYPKPPTKLEIINVIIQLVFNTFVYYTLGMYELQDTNFIPSVTLGIFVLYKFTSLPLFFFFLFELCNFKNSSILYNV